MSFKKFLALFLVLSSFACAYKLQVNVLFPPDTPGVGTNVSVVQEGVELYAAKTDSKGIAQFNLSSGDYFLLLRRFPFLEQVALIPVEKDTNISLIMRQEMSYASIYGQVKGTPDFQNISVSAQKDGKTIGSTTATKNGYYILSFLPEGDYSIVFSKQGFEKKTVPVSLAQGTFTEVSAALEKPAVPLVAVLSSPSAIAQYSTIEVSLFEDSQPLSGKTIDVQSPSGNTTIVTNEKGIAYINAAEDGNYTFSYGSLTSKTTVIGEEKPKPAEENVTEKPAVLPEYKPPAEEKKEEFPYSAFLAALFLLVIVFGAAVIFFTMKKVKKKK